MQSTAPNAHCDEDLTLMHTLPPEFSQLATPLRELESEWLQGLAKAKLSVQDN